MKQKKNRKKSKEINYREKSYVFTSGFNGAPVISDFFSEDDAEKIIDQVFPDKSYDKKYTKEMLNRVIKNCHHFHPNIEERLPGKEDTKKLFLDLQKDIKRTEETLHILTNQYEPDLLQYFKDMDFDYIKKAAHSLREIRLQIPYALNKLSESSGKKRGDNESYAKKTLIHGLVLTYERLTGKTAQENFTQPKAHGLNYQGQFYNFCHVVFEIIDSLQRSLVVISEFPQKLEGGRLYIRKTDNEFEYIIAGMKCASKINAIEFSDGVLPDLTESEALKDTIFAIVLKQGYVLSSLFSVCLDKHSLALGKLIEKVLQANTSNLVSA